jgi:hypothetical protein
MRHKPLPVFAAVVSLIVIISGCGPVEATKLVGDNIANYREIFGEPKPPEVEVVNSLVVKYTFRLGTVTTPDWEVELIAPREWIVQKENTFPLWKADSTDIISAQNRIDSDFVSPWYAPKDISDYDVYYNRFTSIRYVHVLVDRIPVSTDRYRIFLSKH